MRILLLSTYELGHQPLHLATATGALTAAGHEVRAIDLAVTSIDHDLVDWAEAIAVSVPMHTAMRLALDAAGIVRERRPDLPICFYGLYAGVGADRTLESVADHLIAGEYAPRLVEWVEGLRSDGPALRSVVDVGRHRGIVPVRLGLPGLDRYARLETPQGTKVVGYVEASSGCRQRCRHCPVPTIYDGRFRIVDEDVVLADIANLVEMGAEHISFGDPDILNGPKHSLRVVRAMHRRFPRLTFDVTAKVELVLRHRDVWAELAAAGLEFVISAFETTNDHILGLLDKGHTAAEEAEAVHLLRDHGIAVRPTWMPFTPWTSLQDLVEIVTFIDTHAIDVDPVQLSVRLLIPDGSLVLEVPEVAPYLESYDAARLGWQWHAADPNVDLLAQRLAAIAEAGAADDPRSVYAEMREAIFEAAGVPSRPLAAAAPGPRMTEPWFC